MRVIILTPYPEMFPGALGHSIIGNALDNKKWFEKFIDILDIKYSQFNELITDDETGKKAISYFKKLNCTKYIIAQTTFTDAKFITSFAKTFNKPIH